MKMSAVALRRKAIKDKLVKNPGVIFPCKGFLSEFSMTKNMFYSDLSTLRKEDPTIVMKNGSIFYRCYPVREA